MFCKSVRNAGDQMSCQTCVKKTKPAVDNCRAYAAKNAGAPADSSGTLGEIKNEFDSNICRAISL